jgi:outer membrane receptor protein involved in Fe transport
LLNAAGDKIGALPWTFGVNAQYTHDLSALWAQSRGYVRVDLRHFGGFPGGDPRVAGYQPIYDEHRDQAYSLLNFRLGVQRGGWDVSAYVNNVTNSDPTLGFFIAFPTDPLYRAGGIQPRTAGVTAWYRF